MPSLIRDAASYHLRLARPCCWAVHARPAQFASGVGLVRPARRSWIRRATRRRSHAGRFHRPRGRRAALAPVRREDFRSPSSGEDRSFSMAKRCGRPGHTRATFLGEPAWDRSMTCDRTRSDIAALSADVPSQLAAVSLKPWGRRASRRHHQLDDAIRRQRDASHGLLSDGNDRENPGGPTRSTARAVGRVISGRWAPQPPIFAARDADRRAGRSPPPAQVAVIISPASFIISAARLLAVETSCRAKSGGHCCVTRANVTVRRRCTWRQGGLGRPCFAAAAEVGSEGLVSEGPARFR